MAYIDVMWGLYGGWEGVGESRMFHEWKEIEDHRHKNFVLPSHENKQVRYSVLTLEEVFKEL